MPTHCAIEKQQGTTGATGIKGRDKGWFNKQKTRVKELTEKKCQNVPEKGV